ncbi:MAG TPA: hypothetical protein ENF67_01735 [Candidatus Pacearchaeota archaeon]|nr:hypothetical protein [Candidatus Pacearchaeota archaeon]
MIKKEKTKNKKEKEVKMEKHFFWAFFVIALMLGLTIGISYTNITLTASAIAGKEVPWWQKILKGAQSTGPESQAAEIGRKPPVPADSAAEIVNQTFNQSWFPLCNNITGIIYLSDKHEVFLLKECEKAIYMTSNKKYEIVLHDVIGHRAYIEYREYNRAVGSEGVEAEWLCNHQFLALRPMDIGFAVEVLKAFGSQGSQASQLPQGQDGRALLVMPRKMHEDYC